MQTQWLFLKLGQAWDVAIPFALVARVLHRQDPDYVLWAPQAISLAAVLEVRPAPDLPGVLVVLTDGTSWFVGDIALCQGEGWQHLSLPSWVFGVGRQWCRGILQAGEESALIADPDGMRALNV